MSVASSSILVEKVYQESNKTQSDIVAVEEPLELRVGFGQVNQRRQQSISITMRTPGHDFELAAGFFVTEGMIEQYQAIINIEHCGPQIGPSRNIVRIELHPDVTFDLARFNRHFYTTSSCGVCGKASIEALRTKNSYINQSMKTPTPSFHCDLIHSLPEKLFASQPTFDQTGGLHAAALLRTHASDFEFVREDVGRHNAVDKVIGAAFMADMLPLTEHLLFVSGRASFELMQKAAMAGIRFLAAVGAPSSLAVEFAKELDMTLVGFVRQQRFNVYHGNWRIDNLHACTREDSQ